MIIIIDGCDKVGKSTLIENMKNKIPGLLLMKNMDKPKDGSDAERDRIKACFEEMFTIAKDHPNLTFIFDRWFTSEMAYSFKRNYEASLDPWFDEFDAKVAETPSLFVNLWADDELVKQRFLDDGEDFAKAEEVEKIQSRYHAIYEQTKMAKLRLNTTDNLPASVEKILSAVKEIN